MQKTLHLCCYLCAKKAKILNTSKALPMSVALGLVTTSSSVASQLSSASYMLLKSANISSSVEGV